MTPIYRHPTEPERKAGAVAVRVRDGMLFDGQRFFTVYKNPGITPCDCIDNPTTPEEEEALEEWLTRLPARGTNAL